MKVSFDLNIDCRCPEKEELENSGPFGPIIKW